MFCVDCNLKFQQAQDMVLFRMEREHNRLLDEMDMIVGIRTTEGRYPERRPPVTMSGTFNNIRIDRSNIGVVNTGSIQSVEVSLAGIQQGGNATLAAALKDMTEAVVNSTELQPNQKNDAVQMLETVAADAAHPKDQRRPAATRAVLTGFLLTQPGMMIIRHCPAPMPHKWKQSCDRFFLSTPGRGRPRTFCSDACRVRASEKAKDERNRRV